MNTPSEKERETYPWEKRAAREAKLSRPAVKIPFPEIRTWDRLPALGKSDSFTESNHPSFQAMWAFRGLIDDQAALDLAGRSAGARSGLWTPPSELQEPTTCEPCMLADGTIGDLAEFDGYDVPLWEPEEWQCSYTESEATGFHLRDSEFIFYCKNRAGEVMESEQFDKAQAARRALEAQQMDLALGLASQGITAFLPKSAPRVSIVDPFSEQRLDVQAVRRINFFPLVAKARRAPMLTHLNALVEKERWMRMLTFTSGLRVRLDIPGAVRSRFKLLHRRISNLHAHPYMKRIGCRFYFRASEAGTLYRACPFPREKGTEDGVIYAHLHAHVFAKFDHQLSPTGFKKFLRRVKSIWRHHWDYGQKVADPAEACKYPVKPGDLAILTDPEKAAWYRETHRLHIVQPLGELRESIEARHVAALKGRKWRTRCKETGVSKTELRFRPDWNARPRITAEEREARRYQTERIKKLGLSVYSDAARLLCYANGLLLRAAKIRRALSPAAWAAIVSVVTQCQAAARALLSVAHRTPAARRYIGIRKLKEVEREVAPQTVIRNRVCARLGPAPFWDRVFRPGLVVWNFDGNYAALRALPFVGKYGEEVRGLIEAGEAKIAAEGSARSAPSYHSVHTSHLTAVRARGGAGPDPGGLLARAEVWERPPDPQKTPAQVALGRN